MLSLASPGYVFTVAGAWGRSPYWRALGVSHAVGWGLLALACLSVPRAWQEKARRPRASRRSYWWRYGGVRRRQALRRKLLDRNPILWLCSRERWQSLVMWGVSLIVAAVLAAFVMWKARYANSPFGSAAGAHSHGFSWRSCICGWLPRPGASFSRPGAAGCLETLLATPLSVKDVVQGPWRALVRMFGPPVALLLVVQLVGGCLAYRTAWGGGIPHAWSNLAALATSAASTLSTLASLAALAWFGLWMGLTSRNASLATFKTIVLVKVIPFLVIYFVTMYAIALFVILPQTMRMGAASGPPVTTTITNASGSTTTVTVTNTVTAINGIIVSITNASGSTTTVSSTVALSPLYVSLLMTCLPAVLNVGVRPRFHRLGAQPAPFELAPASRDAKKSEIRRPKSEGRRPKSEIRSPEIRRKSEIRNPKSASDPAFCAVPT